MSSLSVVTVASGATVLWATIHMEQRKIRPSVKRRFHICAVLRDAWRLQASDIIKSQLVQASTFIRHAAQRMSKRHLVL